MLWQIPSSVAALIGNGRVTGHEAQRWWSSIEGGAYDRVLIDAPCASERHVLQQASRAGASDLARGDWSEKQLQQQSQLQRDLILAGLQVRII